jgi:hypothetical protein
MVVYQRALRCQMSDDACYNSSKLLVHLPHAILTSIASTTTPCVQL